MLPENLTAQDLLGQITLITGDVNAGKTTLTLLLAGRLADEVGGKRMAIIDLAPTMTQTREAAPAGVGGRLSLQQPDVLSLRAEFVPPRLTADTDKQALAIARNNLERMAELFERFAASGRDVLVVNDASMYLQAADVESFVQSIAPATTLLANGYVGTALGAGRLTDTEQQRMAELADRCDRVIRL